MAERKTDAIQRGLVRFLRRLLALDPGPNDLAGEVADRLGDPLTPDQRAVLRRRFGVDFDTNATLEEIGAQFDVTRRRLREIERKALVRLYRWPSRKHCVPAVQRRLAQRVAAAHRAIFEALCDAPPVRSVLVGWHDQLVDGRRAASEIAALSAACDDGAPEHQTPGPAAALAARLRQILWAHAKGSKATRRPDAAQDHQDQARDMALRLLLETGFNARSVRDMAESLLSQARRAAAAGAAMPPLPDPAEDSGTATPTGIQPGLAEAGLGERPDIRDRDPAPMVAIIAEAGMPITELWTRAGMVGTAIANANHNLRLLADAGMPLVAEAAVAQGLRGQAFFDAMEQGRAALLRLADRFCFTSDMDYAAAAAGAVRAVLRAPE